MKTLILSILFAACLPAQGIFFNTNMPVSGGGFVFLSDVSNTQAVISYTAPSSSACTVEVSESPSYSPLVHDVDAVLFPGDNSDSRSTSIVNGTSRVVVIGARKAALASDANYYSRALQTNTTHYFRIVCGGSTYTGAFRTANIPLGITSNSPPEASTSVPGEAVLPTITGSRSQKIVDTFTGALLSPVSLTGDQVGGQSGTQGVTIYDGAGPRVCNSATVNDGTGTIGYICNLTSRVGYVQVYFIVPSTGEVRNLGWITHPGAYLDNSLNAYYTNSGSIYRMPYTGAFADVGSTYVVGDINTFGTAASFGSPTLYSSTPYADLVKNYDPTFDDTKFFCDPVYYAKSGEYYVNVCKRSSQNSYGWVTVFYGGDGRNVPSSCAGGDTGCPRVVAAWYTFSTGNAARFNGIHQVNLWDNDTSGGKIIGINWGDFSDFGNTSVGFSPIATTTSTTLTSGTNTLTVAGAPTSLASGGDAPANIAIAVGDWVHFRGYSDSYRLTAVSGNNWTITPNATGTIPSGTQVYMEGNVRGGTDGTWAITFWDFINNPSGNDTTSTYVISDRQFPGGGHYDIGVLGRVSESGGGWAAYPAGSGTIMQSLGSAGIDIDSTASFNGVSPPGYGSLLTKHPSYHQRSTNPWFADRVAFGGGAGGSVTGGYYYSASPGATLVSGNLYKYFPDSGWPMTARTRKIMPTQATSGGALLLDISSATTGNQIGTSGADNYKYCFAAKANECRTGSSAGDIYFNVPTLTYAYCTGGDAPNPTNLDACITNMPTYSGTAMQMYLGANSQTLSRNVTGGLAKSPKFILVYPQFKSIPDESYALFTEGITLNSGQVNTWKVKLTPLTAGDSVDRSKFVPKAVNLTAPTGLGVTRAAVRFGYLENGTLSQYYCTSRREACVAASATAPLSDGSADPFWFEGSDTFTGVSCATTCTVTIPVLPVHIAYYQPIYYNAGGTIVATGNVGIVGDYVQ